jgi:hypothetical protein
MKTLLQFLDLKILILRSEGREKMEETRDVYLNYLNIKMSCMIFFK